MIDQWEYKIVYFSADRWTSTGLPSELNAKFDEYGQDGWELVGTESLVRPSFIPWGGSTTVGISGFFKRPIRR